MVRFNLNTSLHCVNLNWFLVRTIRVAKTPQTYKPGLVEGFGQKTRKALLVKKNQRHTTNKKPNMYKDINKDNQYFGLSNRPSSG